ncbi:MAG: DegT/DnrJ/EryC1/StrS family aminotransferase [Jatrophihabitantaceae bacterium]
MTAPPSALRAGHAWIPFAECRLTPGARSRVLTTMASGELGPGPQAEAFEAALREQTGKRHAILTSSGSAALELALRVLDLPPASTVLLPTFSFVSAAHTVVRCGLRPVLVDADERTLTVGPEEVADAARRERPAAMIVDHTAGFPAATQTLADAANLPLSRIVEKGAQVIGIRPGPAPVAAVGAMNCHSFHSASILPIGSGGAITTADPELADRLRIMRQQGMSVDAWRRSQRGASWRYDITELGMGAGCTDLQAAIGLGQLTHVPVWQARRAELAARYHRNLSTIAAITPPSWPTSGTHSWNFYIVKVQPTFGMSRDVLATRLTERAVGTSVQHTPVHHFTYFHWLLGDDVGRLPVADRLADQVLSLPLHPHLSDDDVDYVCTQLAEFAQGCAAQ